MKDIEDKKSPNKNSEAVKKGISQYPSSAECIQNARELQIAGKYEEAITECIKVLEWEEVTITLPQQSKYDAHYALGDIYTVLGEAIISRQPSKIKQYIQERPYMDSLLHFKAQEHYTSAAAACEQMIIEANSYIKDKQTLAQSIGNLIIQLIEVNQHQTESYQKLFDSKKPANSPEAYILEQQLQKISKIIENHKELVGSYCSQDLKQNIIAKEQGLAHVAHDIGIEIALAGDFTSSSYKSGCELI